jgi:hypothetical protein
MEIMEQVNSIRVNKSLIIEQNHSYLNLSLKSITGVVLANRFGFSVIVNYDRLENAFIYSQHVTRTRLQIKITFLNAKILRHSLVYHTS